MLAGHRLVRVPRLWPELSTGRLLTLDWLEGRRLLEHKDDPLAVRNRLATAMFTAWWFPFSRFGVIHGDPHLGNYTVFDRRRRAPAASICSTTAASASSRRNSSAAWSTSTMACCTGDDDLVVHAYETWGFKRLNRELIDTLNIWARFIYGPLLDDRVRSLADGVKPSEYGRRQAFQVHRRSRRRGPVTVPREFVFMDRAAIGLGGVFLHLRAEINFYRLFNEAIENFSAARVAATQAAALAAGGPRRSRR